ncbi:MAG: AMP-dependent synthetase [Acidobacteria bacterium RIFCSPLOWO2_12_FULL_68_19]|nr:MAG: AMP-dependent synthetase [Acidobacteria bacterium RIFCSPLOWO2_12_FULL_68_19]
MPDFAFGGEVAWRPTSAYRDRSRLAAFIARHRLADLDDLQRRSVEDPRWFWRAVLDDLGIEFYEPYGEVLDVSRGIAWPRWCVGGRLNIVHNCLDKWIGTPVAQKAAVRWEGEEGSTRVLTYGELHREVNRCANAFGELGIGRGDRVALFMPMCPELVVAFFASIKIGAVILPLFSGYGADALASRVRDAEAALLVAADGVRRRGQVVPMKAVADEAAAAAPSIRRMVVVPRLGIDVPLAHGRDERWPDLVGRQSDEHETVRTGADDPLMVIYTSGTTGRPKGAVHTHCGFPVKAAQDLAHCLDVHDTDTMFWVTDMGWMMGPWELFGMTLLAGTMVIYDGALDYPGPDRLWSLVARHGVSVLGVSPTLVRALMRHGDAPVRAHDLSSLRILGSTGEPWNPESWRWLFETVGGRRVPIINYSGGTEVSGGLVSGNVLTPIKPCSFAGPPPGIAADVVDEQGHPVRNQVGELVVRAPWIGMTRGFWRDPERYEHTYWSRFPGVWVHGDWAAIDEDGLWYILGRSDDTIKIAGKRLGPAEVESVLVEHPAVIEAAAIGVPDATKGQALVCFCVLRPGQTPRPGLAEDLTSLVGTRLGKPLRPDAIEFVRELPKTRNQKVMRRVIRSAYLHEDPGDLSSLENPQTVQEIQAVRR